ncbi:phosphotransferase [Robbsia sp. Bb-Pol-6]|uniref:Phosphotransferase n=1 Tax=Robbsia betulipollinis TaxID=2981849 RepID=A0ABT3ZLE6_9BURK|nr:phosphotransferase [Robbsia betulipollinis]MCY0387366.1 phosphotransferase [Robbsia betulipollinis]
MTQNSSRSAPLSPPAAAAPPATQADTAADQVADDLRLTALRAWLRGVACAAPTGTDADPGLDVAALAPASSDAGFRRYFRLPARAGSLIAMDAPPPEKSREFVQIQALLAEAGVHVPRILAADVERGFMLLSDLGTTSYLDALSGAGEEDARALMRAALDTLIRWQSASRPQVLPEYDEPLLRRELELLPEWYLGRHLGRTLDATERATLDGVFRTLIDSALAQPRLFVHRDFMPRNLMVAPPAPAVLDFQDAVLGPATYDVASLFRDAFISWDEGFELDCIAWYWGRAKAAGLPVRADFSEYYRELEWMGLQRHLKIIGLFARLAYRDGKPRYLADTPRFIAYARKVAGRYRELTPLARLLDQIENRAETVGYTF